MRIAFIVNSVIKMIRITLNATFAARPRPKKSSMTGYSVTFGVD